MAKNVGIYKFTGDVDAAARARFENHREPRDSEAGFPSLIYIGHVEQGPQPWGRSQDM